MRKLSVPEDYRGYSIRLEPDFSVTFSQGLLCWSAANFAAARVHIDLLHAEEVVRRRRVAYQSSVQLLDVSEPVAQSPRIRRG
jgi:predicted component of viral defense system (DUF524 family)